MSRKLKVGIIGSGNIGTDLMIKILRHGEHIEMGAMVGIDAASDGLGRAARMGVATTHEGVEGLRADARVCRHRHRVRCDVCIGPRVQRCVPAHDQARHPRGRPDAGGDRSVLHSGGQRRAASDAPNVNMVTCGGQATIPMIAAVSQVTNVHYGEIVASISSRSADRTRANIDEFTETTARAIETVGGAARGKAIIVLNPAEPPLMMRDTVHAQRFRRRSAHRGLGRADGGRGAVVRAGLPPEAARAVRSHRIRSADSHSGCRRTHVGPQDFDLPRSRGAAHYLPAYAGNLDIMTSAARAMAEQVAARMLRDAT